MSKIRNFKSDAAMISMKFEWRDLWFGVYVKEPWWEGGFEFHRLYICIIPTLPIVIE